MLTKEKCKLYYHTHKAEISKKRTERKIWLTEEFRKYHRQYYLANKERLNQQQKEWKIKNPEKVKITQAKWFTKNRERKNEKAKIYYKVNVEARRAYGRQYQATPKGRYGGLLFNASKREIRVEFSQQEFCDWFSKQDLWCYYCGVSLRRGIKEPDSLTIDRKNNTDNYYLDNMVLSCRRCNLIKGYTFTEEQMLEIANKYLKGEKLNELRA